MDIAPIKSHRDYRRVLREIEGLMSARRNSPEGDRLDVLVTLVEAWERKHYRLDLPDPAHQKRHVRSEGLEISCSRSGQIAIWRIALGSLSKMICIWRVPSYARSKVGRTSRK